jgi:hypothetical protein
VLEHARLELGVIAEISTVSRLACIKRLWATLDNIVPLMWSSKGSFAVLFKCRQRRCGSG